MSDTHAAKARGRVPLPQVLSKLPPSLGPPLSPASELGKGACRVLKESKETIFVGDLSTSGQVPGGQ